MNSTVQSALNPASSRASSAATAITSPPFMSTQPGPTAVFPPGAIDNSPDGEGASPTGGKLINYVDAALEDVAAGRPVKTSSTKAYGCSVKYGS